MDDHLERLAKLTASTLLTRVSFGDMYEAKNAPLRVVHLAKLLMSTRALVPMWTLPRVVCKGVTMATAVADVRRQLQLS